jgi:hypothetical protein
MVWQKQLRRGFRIERRREHGFRHGRPFVPAIYVFLGFLLDGSEDVDARHKAGHDELDQSIPIKLVASEPS